MSNTNRDYAIIYDIKNSTLILSRPLVFYITDKNTSNIFVRLATKTNVGGGVDQYTDIENASNYILMLRVIKPNDEVTNIRAIQREPESIFEFDLTESFKDVPGVYLCELMISTMVDSRQELITSDSFTYEVKRSILSKIDEIIEHKDTTVEKLLNELDATKAELSSQIKDKATQLENLKSEKYLFFGDSYGEGYTPDGNVTSWCDQVKTLMHIPDNDYYKYVKGGYGFTDGGFEILLDNAIAEISDEDKLKIKHIIVGGGYNDADSYTTIGHKMSLFVVKCKANFPNAKILVAPFGWCVEGLTTGVHENKKITNLINMVFEYQEKALKNGIGYIPDIYSVMHKTDFFSSDYVHPNENGEYNIALTIASYLQSGYFNTFRYMDGINCFDNIVWNSGISGNIQLRATVNNCNTQLQLLNGTITGDFSNVTLNGSNIILGTVRSATIHGYYSKITISTPVVVKTNDNKYIEVNASISVRQNKLYINLIKINEAKDNFETLSFNEITLYTPSSIITVNSLIN